MPLLNVRCPNGHCTSVYVASMAARYRDVSRVCACGHPYIPQLTVGTPLLYFSEKRPQYIDNLGATIRSHGQHVQVMKERGVTPATEWHVSRSMRDGLKTRAPQPHPQTRIKGA